MGNKSIWIIFFYFNVNFEVKRKSNRTFVRLTKWELNLISQYQIILYIFLLQENQVTRERKRDGIGILFPYFSQDQMLGQSHSAFFSRIFPFPQKCRFFNFFRKWNCFHGISNVVIFIRWDMVIDWDKLFHFGSQFRKKKQFRKKNLAGKVRNFSISIPRK